MIRPFTLVCAATACFSGLFLYTTKHHTTVLDQKISKIVHETRRIKATTSMLRTQWTLLNQPERLERLADRFLPSLRPMSPRQFVQMSSLRKHIPAIPSEREPPTTRDVMLAGPEQTERPAAHAPDKAMTPAEAARPAENIARATTPAPHITPRRRPRKPAAPRSDELNDESSSSVQLAKTANNASASRAARRKTHASSVELTQSRAHKPLEVAQNVMTGLRPASRTATEAAASSTAAHESVRPAKALDNGAPHSPLRRTTAAAWRPVAAWRTAPSDQETAAAPRRKPPRHTSYGGSALGGAGQAELPPPVPLSH